jgi:hypothetical protein
MVVDFNTQQLFGDDIDLIPPVTFRGIRTNDKKAVTKFCETMYSHLADNDAWALQVLLDTDQATPAQAEHVDTLIGAAGNIAESRCQRRRPEYYSRALVQQRVRVSLLKSHLSALKRSVDRTEALQTRMLRQGVQLILPPTLLHTAAELRQAITQLRDLSKDHIDQRSQEMTARSEDADGTQQHQKARAIRKIKKSEENRRTYRILEAMRRRTGEQQRLDRLEIPTSWPPPHSELASVSILEDPKECTAWTTVTDPTAIEYYLLLRNRLHFGQAEGTPFTVPPLNRDIDWAASSASAAAILAGTYLSTINVPQCQELLRVCQSTSPLDAIPADLSMDSFKGKIRSWKESTTTSPSGRHLGRYKALFTPGDHANNSDEHAVFSNSQAAIASLLLSVINFCIRNGHVLHRWKTIVNVMIFKD